MRYLLDSSKAETVSLRAEIRFLEDYVSLEKIRLSKNADIQFEVSGIDEDVFIPPLLFIPLVENAFKHGLNTLSVENYAHFALSVQSNGLFFEAKNSLGNAMDTQPQSGTGLNNLRKRLHLLYPEKHQLVIEKSVRLFKAILHIEL
jgi:LytS/YehU family sensor histidine kinase